MANLTTLMNQVFSQDLLLDIILDYALHTSQNTDVSTLQIVRLVNSTWLQSASRILKKLKKPLFKLQLTSPTTGSSYLDAFLTTVTDGVTKFGRSLPSFSLDIRETFLVEENFHSFLRFWNHPCTAGLLKVQMFLKGTDPPLTATLPRVSFPLLTKLNVAILIFDENCKNMKKYTNLIQAFLNGVESPGFQFSMRGSIPSESRDLKRLDLPYTHLHTLELFSAFCRAMVEGPLSRDPLPNLSSLVLHTDKLPDGQVFQLLDKVKSTLVFLTLSDLAGFSLTVVCLPVMEKLKALRLVNINVDQENGKRRPLERWLPKLEILALMSEELFENWVQHYTFPKIKNLEINLWKRVKTELGLMQRIHSAFPNVTKLSISMHLRRTTGLKYLFQEMKQLINLKIAVRVNSEVIENTDLWASLFTGIPVKTVRLLRVNPDLWAQFDLQLMECQGIRNLQGLTHFDLRITENPEIFARTVSSRHSVISKLAFSLGFLKMRKLKSLLYGEFLSDPVPRLSLADLWEERG